MRHVLHLLLFCCFSFEILAQEAPTQNPPQDFKNNAQYQDIFKLQVHRAETPIKIDGELNESAWQNAEIAKDFWVKFPDDNRIGKERSEMRVTYDDKNVYFGATCYGDAPYIIQTLKRDAEFRQSDGILIVIDAMNQRTNGVQFSCTPAANQSDASLTSDDNNYNWDTKWEVETHYYEGYWTAEFAIPLKSLRFKEGNKRWGVNFIRNNIKANEFHTWTRMPRNLRGFDLGFTGSINFDDAPRLASGNSIILPYTTGSISRNYKDKDQKEPFRTFNGGIDAKLSLTPALSLDLTINPDFSQIEVDRQQTNLTRFDISYPERRPFFLENGDLFADFGIPPVRPFFSRSIGLNNNGGIVPILYGARLNGNLTDKMRVGLMNLQTEGGKDRAPENYAVAAFSQKVLHRSIFRGMVTNRQAFDKNGIVKNDYGRTASAEFVYINPDNTFSSWLAGQQSWKPNITNNNNVLDIGFLKSSEDYSFLIDFFHVGTNFQADMGFVPRLENYDAVRDTVVRLGFNTIYNEATYKFFPEKESSLLSFVEIGAENFVVFNPNNTWNDGYTAPSVELNFKSKQQISATFTANRTDLLFPFSFTGEKPLPKAKYLYNRINLNYTSDNRKPFYYTARFETGGFYNGKSTTVSSELTYRKQPWGNFGLFAEYNRLKFPATYGETTLWLIGPKVEVSFSKKAFWTTFLQYNTQRDNFNVNSRFQWRFKPMSDLFIVYTDNYAVNKFLPKNRALVFKLSYWFAI
jgi:Domain of unknown function (DUF5916)/Carbohydrate family 9 binding domain-like